jgi:outer membrane protein assembly factor BamE (lipoprotein component of BamABCDE complex)
VNTVVAWWLDFPPLVADAAGAMKTVFFISSLALLFLSGCSTPGSAYAGAHPELSQAHRKILVSGKIPGGLAVEGMSKEQVRLAVGNPARVEKIGGREGWVYVREMGFESDAGGHNSPMMPPGGGDPGPRRVRIEKTTVVFDGDRAIQAQIGEETESLDL